MSKICVTLTAYNMGSDATEDDYDAWVAYVASHLDEAVGFVVDEVDGIDWKRPQPGRDRVEGATDEQERAILSWLAHDGWDAFCASGGLLS